MRFFVVWIAAIVIIVIIVIIVMIVMIVIHTAAEIAAQDPQIPGRPVDGDGRHQPAFRRGLGGAAGSAAEPYAEHREQDQGGRARPDDETRRHGPARGPSCVGVRNSGHVGIIEAVKA